MILPMSNRILILPNEAQTSWDKGGLLLKSDMHRERPQEGTVLASGPEVKDKLIQPGTQILYGKFSGSEVNADGVELLILVEDDVLGKVSTLSLAAVISAAGREMPKPQSVLSGTGAPAIIQQRA